MGAQVHFISLKEVPAGQRRYLSAMAELGDGPQSTADVAEALGRTAGSTSVNGSADRVLSAGCSRSPLR